jgi:hypothetical protein
MLIEKNLNTTWERKKSTSKLNNNAKIFTPKSNESFSPKDNESDFSPKSIKSSFSPKSDLSIFKIPMNNKKIQKVPNNGYYLFVSIDHFNKNQFYGFLIDLKEYSKKNNFRYDIIKDLGTLLLINNKNIILYIIYEHIKWFMNVELEIVDNMLSSCYYFQNVNESIKTIVKFIDWSLSLK